MVEAVQVVPGALLDSIVSISGSGGSTYSTSGNGGQYRQTKC